MGSQSQCDGFIRSYICIMHGDKHDNHFSLCAKLMELCSAPGFPGHQVQLYDMGLIEKEHAKMPTLSHLESLKRRRTKTFISRDPV